MYVRYGVHKDRESIKDMKDNIDGICVPSNILAYSREPTQAAILLFGKEFFVDPMTYIYQSSKFEDYIVVNEEDGSRNFKPSVAKMTTEYGLTEYFKKNKYEQLKVTDFTDEFIENLCIKNFELQTGIHSGSGSAMTRYADILAEVGVPSLKSKMEDKEQMPPKFIVPPYFFFSGLDDKWLNINKKLYEKTKEIVADEKYNVVPIIFTKASSLSPDLLDYFNGVGRVILWLDDFQENGLENKEKNVQDLVNYKNFAIKAKTMNISLINLYGGYYSIMLSKCGVTGICNGVVYGESKSFGSSVGGVPPVRYYVKSLHRFLPLTAAASLLGDQKGKDLLDVENKECMELIGGDINQIYLMKNKENISKTHMQFILSRKSEMSDVSKWSEEEILAQLENTYAYKDIVEQYYNKKLEYLVAWREAFSTTTQEEK